MSSTRNAGRVAFVNSGKEEVFYKCSCGNPNAEILGERSGTMFLTSTPEDFLAPTMQNEVHVQKCARTPGKRMPSKVRFRRPTLCASQRSRKQHTSQNAIPALTKPADQNERVNEHTLPVP